MMLMDKRNISKNQIDFIRSLTESDHYYQYPSRFKKPDILNSFLSSRDKPLDELSVNEGSELIEVLLDSIEVYFTFPCGLKSWVDREISGRSYVMGDLEGCMHGCPDELIRGDVNNCPFWLDYKEVEF